MKLHQLIDAVYNEPALITPGAHASIRQLLESRLGLSSIDAREPGKNECGREVAVEQAYVDDDGIAHIPVNGALGQGLSPFDRGSGAVDTLDIRQELADFLRNKKVHSAILDMDTPGGMVLGTPETAAAIGDFAQHKPIYAFTRGMIASAGYWLAANTNGIYATPSSSIGSIGTVITFHDLSKRAEMMGIKVDVIKSGTYKGMGMPGTSLTDAHREHLQERIDKLTAQFKAHVIEHRGEIPDSAMQGQMHMAGEALSLGLIDAIIPNKAALISEILTQRQRAEAANA